MYKNFLVSKMKKDFDFFSLLNYQQESVSKITQPNNKPTNKAQFYIFVGDPFSFY